MASLENKKIKDTYEGLLKTDDNAAIDGAVEITDGAGNGTGVTISNDGQVTATGTVSFGSLKDTGEDITVTKFVDEADGIGNNDNDTSVPTSAAVKDYVDTNVTAQDLDFQGDSGTGAVDLDSQSLDIAGGTGIDTSAVDQTLTVNIDSTVATLSDTQTLTNKTVDADNNTVSNLEVDNLKSGVLDTDLTTVSASDDTLASAKAIKTYVDSNITAQDLDITDGTTTSAVDLDSQTLTIEGTANEVEVSLTDQTFTVGLPTSITTNVTGNLTGNVTGDVTGNADTASALETARTISLSGDVAGSVSFDGSANADITAIIQANSVALGTDTTGDYVENLGTGTGVTIGSNSGEGSSPTISVDYGSTANTAVQGDTSLTIQGTANEIEVTGGGVTLGSGGTVTVGLPNDVSLGGSLTIAQNLTVNGTTTTVNTDTLSVEDPLIELARDNSENSVDVGLYGKYSLDSGVTTKYSGLFKDASDSDKFKLFKGLEVEPTATVDTAGTGYTKGDLVINDLDAVDGVFSGDLTVDTNTLYVNSSTNQVGIGATPNSKLTVFETGASGIATVDISGGASGAGSLQISAGKVLGTTSFDLIQNSSGAYVYQRDSNPLILGTANTERMRITSSGDVTIGVGTNFGNKLTIYDDLSSGSTPFVIRHTTGDDLFSIYLNQSTGETRLEAAFDGSTDHFTFYTQAAERMRIDSSGNVGIGTSSPDSTLTINGNGWTKAGHKISGYYATNAADGEIINLGVTGNIAYLQSLNGTTPNALNLDGSSVAFRTGSYSTAMTIDSSGNVGIGTTSPSSSAGFDPKLHLESANPFLIYKETDQSNSWETGSWGGNYVVFNGDSERLRIDSSGYSKFTRSVGGVIASFYDGTYGVDLAATATGGSVQTFNTNQTLNLNTFGTGDITFTTSGTSERMRIDSSGNAIFTKSGGAYLQLKDGSAVRGAINVETSDGLIFTTGSSFTERMRISSGGDLLIGTTSETYGADKLTIKGSNKGISTSPGGNLAIFTSDSVAADKGGSIVLGGTYSGTTTYQFAGIAGLKDNSTSGQAGGYLAFYTTNVSNATPERMRIDSSGNVSIKASGADQVRTLSIQGTNGASETYQFNLVADGENAAAKFMIGVGGGSATERMRISSGGDILFGTTGTPNGTSVYGSAFIDDTDSANILKMASSKSTAKTLIQFLNPNGSVGTIQTNGSATAYNTSSDYRLKENVVDMTGALDRVDQLEPKRFNFIADEDTTVDGFLAHEVQDIVPEAVTGEKDAVDEDGNDIYQGIDQSKLVPLLVGAIKELRAEVNSLKAQINN